MSGLLRRHQLCAALAVTFAVGAGRAEESQAAPTPPPGTSQGWLDVVTDGIRDGEYHLSPARDGGWTAPNRKQDLRATWRDGQLVVRPRVEGDAWAFTYQLASVGREGLPPAALVVGVTGERVDGGRVEWEHAGIVEWYSNGERGIEQGFTLVERPGGDPNASIVIEGWIDGLLAFPSEDGGSILLRTPAGADAMRIRDLTVHDANGVELEACLSVATGRMQISLDDRHATFPVTIDPLITSPAWVVEGDRASVVLGQSVATAGDVNGDGYADVIVGDDGYDNGLSDSGRAFVFHGSPSGLATTPAWRGGCDQSYAHFGASVSTAGDVNGDGYSDVIVGASYYRNGQDREGRAFAFHGSSSGLATTPGWIAESDQVDAHFGAVATAGDVNGDGYSDVIVGAERYDNGEIDEGRTFAYLGSAGGLAMAPAWMAEGGRVSAEFGRSVATAGDVNGDGYSDVIVGAWRYDNGQLEEGRAVAFHGSPSGLGMTPAWTREMDQPSARFGTCVATAGDVNGDGYSDVIVGAYAHANGESSEGGAFAFHGSASGLGTTPAWTAESDEVDAWFGTFVAPAGDINGDGYADVLVGCPRCDSQQGSALAYLGAAAGLGAMPAWTVESEQAGADFGHVAAAGDVNGDGYSDVIIGAPIYNGAAFNEGRVYGYHGSASGLAAVPGWTAESDQAGANFGVSVSTAGDVNGDGYSDVIVGAHQYDNGQPLEGRAFTYHGSASGLGTTAAWAAEGDQADAGYGLSVATAGDVNGDGYSDVVVGAFTFDNGEADEGRAFAYFGSSSGLSSVAGWTAESDEADAQFGLTVATAGDVNGDGYSDVLVGAWLQDNGQTNAGRATAYLGSAAGLGAVPAWVAESDQGGAFLGASLGSAGDVNGDGYSDVIVGAHYFDNGEADEGRASVYHGSAAGLGATPTWTAEGDQVDAHFGRSVSTAGDVNGDGYSDVIVGASHYDSGQVDEGRSFAYLGSAAGLSATPSWTAEGDQGLALLGTSASTAGDVNGDGYSDVIIGAPGYDNGETDEGRTFAYLGSAAGLGATPAWTAEGDQAGAQFGRAAKSAGDVNGDGYSDVIIGAHAYTNGQSFEGRALLYYGNDGDGLDRIPRQRGADGSAPIDLLGLGDSTDGFRIHARARSPFGRDRVRLEAEVEPLGTPFDDTGFLTTPHVDTGTPGAAGSFVDLDILKAPLGRGPQHWRVRMRGMFPFPWQSHWLSPPLNGATETDLRVAGANPVACDAGAPQEASCPGGTVMLDGSGSSGPGLLAFLWSSPAPEIVIASPTSAVTDVTVTLAGTFTVDLTVTSGADSASCATTVTLADIAVPVEVSAPAAGVQLRVMKEAAVNRIYVSFEDRGAPAELFSLYAGTILPAGLVAYDHAPVACKVSASPIAPGVAELVAPWDAGASHYYLVSASNCAGESTRGFRSDGIERPSLPTDCGGLP